MSLRAVLWRERSEYTASVAVRQEVSLHSRIVNELEGSVYTASNTQVDRRAYSHL
jgi:hypothetical protein